MLKLPDAMSKTLSTKAFIFSQIMILTIGIVTLLIINYFVNVKGQTAKLYSPTGAPVTSEPATLSLNISSPDGDILSFNSSIIVSGDTNPESTVLISSDAQNLILESKNDGSFSSTFSLDEGVNNITIAVFNKLGDIRTQNRTIYYSKEKI